MQYGHYKEKWISLLSSKRFVDDDSKVCLKEPAPLEGRSPFEADIGRAIFSQPFRRLAGKTQVHPFASVDYIHNRLTHSIEAGHVSRALGRSVAMFIKKVRGDIAGDDAIQSIGWICQAAGLMHDIGNPPYGHAGEDAIRAWTAQNEAALKEICGEKVTDDFKYFDGNAQAFRMASRPGLRETCYFRLTAAALGAMVKYPYCTGSSNGKKGKSAAFSTEEMIFDTLWKELGLGKEKRHPLSYITEAADDICYRINDFEDAVLMGLLDEDEVKEMLMDGMSFDLQCRLNKEKASLPRVRALTIGALVTEFANVFKANYEMIMEGELEKDLKSRIGDKWGGVLARIKEKYDLIFSERKKVVSEIGSFGQIGSVLDKYMSLLREMSNRGEGSREFESLSFLSQRLITLAWGGRCYYEANANRPMDWWGHAVLDFVVGMTDEYLHKCATEFL